VLAFNRAEPRPVLYLSIGALIAGVAVTLAADSADSAAGFFAGTAIAGVGFGGGFQGGIRLVIPLVGERERAGVLSLLYVVSYLGLGVPAVIAGVLVTEVNGLLDTAREYGVAVIVLAVLALGGLLLTRKTESPVQDAGRVAYVDAGDGAWAVQGDAEDDVTVPGRLEEQALARGAGVAGLDADRARIAAD
ncbi:MAG TPA: MFS transporter, partial [Streptosporangiaceae bacterium]